MAATFDLAAANRTERAALVELFSSLPEERLAEPSLCAGWDVGDVLAHLVTPYLMAPARVMALAARHGGMPKGMMAAAAEVRTRPLEEQIDALRGSEERPFVPPLIGLGAPLTDAVVHGEDVRVPLGIDRAVPPDTLRTVLEFGMSWRAAPVFIPFRRLNGLRFVATDLEWVGGSGAEVRGPALELVRAMFGRIGAATDLAGDGVEVLADRAS